MRYVRTRWILIDNGSNPVQIAAVSLSVRHHLAAHTSVKAVRFITNYLLPPPKRAVLAYLGIPLVTAELVKDEDRIPIVRKAEVDVSCVWFTLAPGTRRRPVR